MKIPDIGQGIATRALLFVSTYITIPILLNQMGITKYAKYVYIVSLINLMFTLEFGNSNNLVEIQIGNRSPENLKSLINHYIQKAKKLFFFAIIIVAIFITGEYFFNLNPDGIQFNSDMRISIIAGVIGVGITFIANIYTKFGFANGHYKTIMNITALSILFSTLAVIAAAQSGANLWLCISLQFILQPTLVILWLRQKKFSSNEQVSNLNKIRQIEGIPSPHMLFKFYAIFTPIYGNVVVLLYARQSDSILFIASSTIYRIASIPLVFANFAWLNMLWIEIGKLERTAHPSQIRKLIIKRISRSLFFVLPFFVILVLLGPEIVNIWTTQQITVSHAFVFQFASLGFVQFLGVVPGAVLLVYRKTKIILITHLLYLCIIFSTFITLGMSKESWKILPTLISAELIVILVPGLLWIYFHFKPSNSNEVGKVQNEEF